MPVVMVAHVNMLASWCWHHRHAGSGGAIDIMLVAWCWPLLSLLSGGGAVNVNLLGW